MSLHLCDENSCLVGRFEISANNLKYVMVAQRIECRKHEQNFMSPESILLNDRFNIQSSVPTCLVDDYF